MSCTYIKQDGSQYKSIKDLVEDFYKSNYELKNAAIYSRDEIMQSTIDKILKISKINSYSESDSEKYIPLTKFITRVSPEF
jgi:hypothetical protein